MSATENDTARQLEEGEALFENGEGQTDPPAADAAAAAAAGSETGEGEALSTGAGGQQRPPTPTTANSDGSNNEGEETISKIRGGQKSPPAGAAATADAGNKNNEPPVDAGLFREVIDEFTRGMTALYEQMDRIRELTTKQNNDLETKVFDMYRDINARLSETNKNDGAATDAAAGQQKDRRQTTFSTPVKKPAKTEDSDRRLSFHPTLTMPAATEHHKITVDDIEFTDLKLDAAELKNLNKIIESSYTYDKTPNLKVLRPNDDKFSEWTEDLNQALKSKDVEWVLKMEGDDDDPTTEQAIEFANKMYNVPYGTSNGYDKGQGYVYNVLRKCGGEEIKTYAIDLANDMHRGTKLWGKLVENVKKNSVKKIHNLTENIKIVASKPFAPGETFAARSIKVDQAIRELEVHTDGQRYDRFNAAHFLLNAMLNSPRTPWIVFGQNWVWGYEEKRSLGAFDWEEFCNHCKQAEDRIDTTSRDPDTAMLLQDKKAKKKHWCTFHKKDVNHKESECRLNPKNAKDEASDDDSSDNNSDADSNISNNSKGKKKKNKKWRMDLNHIECFNCHKRGHIAVHCPKKKEEKEEANFCVEYEDYATTSESSPKGHEVNATTFEPSPERDEQSFRAEADSSDAASDPAIIAIGPKETLDIPRAKQVEDNTQNFGYYHKRTENLSNIEIETNAREIDYDDDLLDLVHDDSNTDDESDDDDLPDLVQYSSDEFYDSCDESGQIPSDIEYDNIFTVDTSLPYNADDKGKNIVGGGVDPDDEQTSFYEQHQLYTAPPDKYEDSTEKGRIFKLQRSIFGLNQTAYSWSQMLKRVLIKMDYEQFTKDQPALIFTTANSFYRLALYDEGIEHVDEPDGTEGDEGESVVGDITTLYDPGGIDTPHLDLQSTRAVTDSDTATILNVAALD
mmetsp:Transcript_11800/g.29487  ORF Transcript_11800/g.29487 Transcript_11800/m.29487 type:complete len:907 (-) Transcript_11800:320-3040(-)